MNNQNALNKQTLELGAKVLLALPEMPVEKVQYWIENGKELKKVLKNALFPLPTPDLKIWKTIKIGTGLQPSDFEEAIKEKDCIVSDWAKDIISKPAFTVSQEEQEIKLVKLTVRELGFEEGATTKEIYERAQELVFKLCPAEVGPQLRLQYLDQPKGEWIRVAMKPITDSGGDLGVFRVAHGDGGRYLACLCGIPDRYWPADGTWVFVSSK